MRIVIPTQHPAGLESKVHGHFGSAAHFLLCDTETGTFETSGNADHGHEHGQCNPLGAIQGLRPDVLITGGIGGRALQLLQQGGVRAFRAATGERAGDLIEALKTGRLPEITPQDACGHHHGCHE
jgi:predicted Fe-Mo cluster-binding NifX family protein